MLTRMSALFGALASIRRTSRPARIPMRIRIGPLWSSSFSRLYVRPPRINVWVWGAVIVATACYFPSPVEASHDATACWNISSFPSPNQPANGMVFCKAVAELPISNEQAAMEIGGQAKWCDPIWQACDGPSIWHRAKLENEQSWAATANYREFLTDPCCSGAVIGLNYNSSLHESPPVKMTKNAGKPQQCGLKVCNPINVGIGNKYQREQDYLGTGPFPLRFERHYNSVAGVKTRHVGVQWQHTYDRTVVLDTGTATLDRADGRILEFQEVAGEWVGDPDVPGRLRRLADGSGVPTGWEYTETDDSIETYDNEGMLLSITSRTGFTQSLSYDASDRLIQVAGPFGRTLTFSYDLQDHLESMTDPTGGVYQYAYDVQGNLVNVTYPDDTLGNLSDGPVRIYHYEDSTLISALTGITDENGNRFATWSYDANRRAVSSTHAGGANNSSLTYNPDGTTTLIDSLGSSRTFGFDISHGQVRLADLTGGPCGMECSATAEGNTYDTNGYPASRTDFNGNQTTFVYDARGLETSRTEAVGTPEQRTITTQWHTTFRLRKLITEPGKTTAFTYDAQGRLLTRTETDTVSGGNRTTTNTYNAQGLLATRDGPRTDVTDVTTFTYDARGNLTETTNALGHVNRVTAYDAHGRPLTLEDPNALITTLAYDARGKLLSRDVGGQLTTFEYDGVGNVTKTTLPDGSFLLSGYDDAQRLVAIEDNLGNRTELTLDAAGNRIEETVKDPTSNITRTRTRIYNALNRLTKEIGGAGQATEFQYDPVGSQAAVVDGNTRRTTSEYDALNRLAKSIDPDLGETTFGYDVRDNLVSVTDAEGLATTFTYGGLANLTAQSSPDTGLTQFTYDDAGNHITQLDARGVMTDFFYDALNRLEAIEYSNAAKNVGFEYDAGPNGIGHLTRMTDESGVTDFVYDIRGNLLSETRTIDGVAYATAYTYDSADRVLTITYPSGTIVTYTRDALGRIDSVSATIGDVTQTLASNIAYLPFGPLEGFDYGNNIPLTRVYDQDYRLTSQTAGVVQDISLGYDPADNITTLTDVLNGARNQMFTYDGLNRLTQGQGIYGTQDYSYDGIGNRLNLASSAGVDTYEYASGSHRLESITGPNGTSFGYDANGNTVAKSPLSFTYDDTNRMTEAFASGVRLAAYTYNAWGERVKKAGAEGGSTPSESVLFSDDFTSPDGVVIDDQPDNAWRGKRPRAMISATVDAGAAHVAPGQAIRTAATFTDTGDTTLIVSARLVQGTLVLKHPGSPRGVRVRFNGKRRVAVTSGAFDDAARRTKVIFRLPVPSRHVDIELRLRAGTVRVVVTDDQGGSQDTGNITNPALGPGDTYRLKLRAIKVKGVPVPGLFDDIQVSRRSDTGSATTTHFVYDQGRRLIGEYDATGTPTAEYVFLGTEPLATLRDGAIYYYHTDQLGTPQSLTDQDQTLVWRADYTPFGNTIISVNIVENRMRFPGQYFDAETGLHYNVFRDYDPATGRYAQSDPISLRGGINTYAYVRSNPIRLSDRLGLEDVSVDPSFGTQGRFGSTQAAFSLGNLETSVDSKAGFSQVALLLPEFGASVGFCFPAPEPQGTKSTECVKRDAVRTLFGLFEENVSVSVPLRRVGATFASSGALCFSVGTPFGLPLGNIGRDIRRGSQPSPSEAIFIGG